MPLSEHVYCVSIAFKMNEQVKPQICIKFCVKLKYSSAETVQMIQKAFEKDAMRDWQLHRNNTPACTPRLMQNSWQNIKSSR